MISFSAKNITPEGSYRFLSDDDILRPDDLIRHTYYPLIGDYVDQNRLNWTTVESCFPVWIGKSLGELLSGPCKVEVIRKI